MMSVRKAIKITKNSYFQDTKEKLKAEATTTDSLPIPSRFGEYVYPPTFSMDDFEGNIACSSVDVACLHLDLHWASQDFK